MPVSLSAISRFVIFMLANSSFYVTAFFVKPITVVRNLKSSMHEDVLHFVKERLKQIKPFDLSSGDDICCQTINGTELNTEGKFRYFKCFDKRNPEKAVLIKTCDSSFSSRPTVDSKLSLEFDGAMAFDKYVPFSTPKVFLYDLKESVLITEWLPESYNSLTDRLIIGLLNTDCSRKMGTILGRSHARTHSSLTLPEARKKYITAFAENWQNGGNIPSFISNFDSLIAVDDEKSTVILKENENLIKDSLLALAEIYEKKKQTVIHADLRSCNILVNTKIDSLEDEDESDVLFKVLGFGSVYYGPPGLDLGQFLSNHLWYFAAHTNPETRRSLLTNTLSFLESYKSAFTVQFVGIEASIKGGVSVDNLINEVFTDALGFLGLHVLFMALAVDQAKVLPLSDVHGMSWGDVSGWRNAIRRRQVRLALESFQKFQLKKYASSMDLSDFLHIFESDDKYLTTEHPTEFWHI